MKPSSSVHILLQPPGYRPLFSTGPGPSQKKDLFYLSQYSPHPALSQAHRRHSRDFEKCLHCTLLPKQAMSSLPPPFCFTHNNNNSWSLLCGSQLKEFWEAGQTWDSIWPLQHLVRKANGSHMSRCTFPSCYFRTYFVGLSCIMEQVFFPVPSINTWLSPIPKTFLQPCFPPSYRPSHYKLLQPAAFHSIVNIHFV